MNSNDIIQAYNGFLLFDMSQILKQVEYSVSMTASSYYKPCQQDTIISDDHMTSYVVVYPDVTKNESTETIFETASSSSSLSSNLCFSYSTEVLINDPLGHESVFPARIE